MKRIRFQIGGVIALGILALGAGLFAHLALTDIYHDEADTSLEWRIVQAAALIMLLYIGSSLVTLRQTYKRLKN